MKKLLFLVTLISAVSVVNATPLTITVTNNSSFTINGVAGSIDSLLDKATNHNIGPFPGGPLESSQHQQLIYQVSPNFKGLVNGENTVYVDSSRSGCQIMFGATVINRTDKNFTNYFLNNDPSVSVISNNPNYVCVGYAKDANDITINILNK